MKPAHETLKRPECSVFITLRCFSYCSIGYPVVTLGFGFKSYVSYRLRVVSILLQFFFTTGGGIHDTVQGTTCKRIPTEKCDMQNKRASRIAFGQTLYRRTANRPHSPHLRRILIGTGVMTQPNTPNEEAQVTGHFS